MKNIFKSWKTTLAAIAAIATLAGSTIAAAAVMGPIPAIIQTVTDPTSLAILAAAFGLFAAKDADKSGLAPVQATK